MLLPKRNLRTDIEEGNISVLLHKSFSVAPILKALNRRKGQSKNKKKYKIGTRSKKKFKSHALKKNISSKMLQIYSIFLCHCVVFCKFSIATFVWQTVNTIVFYRWPNRIKKELLLFVCWEVSSGDTYWFKVNFFGWKTVLSWWLIWNDAPLVWSAKDSSTLFNPVTRRRIDDGLRSSDVLHIVWDRVGRRQFQLWIIFLDFGSLFNSDVCQKIWKIFFLDNSARWSIRSSFRKHCFLASCAWSDLFNVTRKVSQP